MEQQYPIQSSYTYHLNACYASCKTYWGQYVLQRTQNNQRALSCISLITHQVWFYRKESRSKGMTALCDTRLQPIFKFAITAQLNYEISLPNQFTHSSSHFPSSYHNMLAYVSTRDNCNDAEASLALSNRQCNDTGISSSNAAVIFSW